MIESSNLSEIPKEFTDYDWQKDENYGFDFAVYLKKGDQAKHKHSVALAKKV